MHAMPVELLFSQYFTVHVSQLNGPSIYCTGIAVYFNLQLSKYPISVLLFPFLSLFKFLIWERSVVSILHFQKFRIYDTYMIMYIHSKIFLSIMLFRYKYKTYFQLEAFIMCHMLSVDKQHLSCVICYL